MCTKTVWVCDTRGAGVALHACQAIIPSDKTAEREKQEHSDAAWSDNEESIIGSKKNFQPLNQTNKSCREWQTEVFEVARRHVMYEFELWGLLFSWFLDLRHFYLSAEHFCLMVERVWVRMCHRPSEIYFFTAQDYLFLIFRNLCLQLRRHICCRFSNQCSLTSRFSLLNHSSLVYSFILSARNFKMFHDEF